MRSYAASRGEIYWKVRLPGIAAIPVHRAEDLGDREHRRRDHRRGHRAGIADGLGRVIIDVQPVLHHRAREALGGDPRASLLGIAFYLVIRARRDLRPARPARRRRRLTGREEHQRRCHRARHRPPPSRPAAGRPTRGRRQGVRARRPADDDRARGDRPRRSPGRVRLAHRAVGLRQVDAAADHRRPDRADARRRSIVNGKPAERARRDRDYGMVFQAPVLFDWRTVEDNVKLPLEILGADAAERTARAARDARARRAGRVRQALPVPAVGRHAAAGRDRPGARRSSRRSC